MYRTRSRECLWEVDVKLFERWCGSKMLEWRFVSVWYDALALTVAATARLRSDVAYYFRNEAFSVTWCNTVVNHSGVHNLWNDGGTRLFDNVRLKEHIFFHCITERYSTRIRSSHWSRCYSWQNFTNFHCFNMKCRIFFLVVCLELL